MTSIVLPSSAVNIVYQIALTTNGIRILSRPTKLAAQKIKYILLLSTVTTFVHIIYYCLPSNSLPPALSKILHSFLLFFLSLHPQDSKQLLIYYETENAMVFVAMAYGGSMVAC